MIWIIGEYAERIDNADELLESFLDSFQDENTQVQLQLLTAIVKLFLKRPADTQELVQQVKKLTLNFNFLCSRGNGVKNCTLIFRFFLWQLRMQTTQTLETVALFTGVFCPRTQLRPRRSF